MVYPSVLSNRWIGKATLGVLALAFAPLLVGGSLVLQALILLLAIALGQQWDSYARTRFSPTDAEASPRRLLAAADAGDPWLVFAFAGMGRLASTGGPVQSAQLQLAEEIMARYGLDARGRRSALSWFNAGKRLASPLSEIAERCVRAPDPRGEALVLECFGRMAATRDSAAMAQMLGGLGSLLQFKRRTGPQSLSAADATPHAQALDDAELLNVALDDCSEAIKLAYRRGVARFHPDRLPQDATPAQRALSERRMVRFREAYERMLAAGADNRLTQPRIVRSKTPSADRSD